MKLTTFFFALMVIYNVQLQAKSSTYTITSIKLIGAGQLDRQTILSNAGIYEGMIVKNETSVFQSVVKKLWKLDVFEDVQIEKGSANGSILLKLKVSPRLNSVVYKGVLKKDTKLLASKIQVPNGIRLTPNLTKICLLYTSPSPRDA